MIKDLVLRGSASLAGNAESTTVPLERDLLSNIPGKGQDEFSQTTSTVKSSDNNEPTTTQETAIDEDPETTTFGKVKQQNGKEKPLLVISLGFEGSLAEGISEQFLSGSISTKAEDATGLKTIVVSEERLSSLADDESDIILVAVINSEGGVTLATDQGGVIVDTVDNMDEIIAQVTTILNTEAEDIFKETESDQPVSIELPNIPSTDDPSTLGLGEVLVVNVLGDLGDDDEKIEAAKKDLERYVREKSGLRVYTEDSEEVVGPALS